VSPGPLVGDKAPSNLAFLLSQVGIHSAGRFATRIEEVGLTPPQFRILNLVDAAEGSSQQAIGEAVDVPASRMVALVDELEESGLVERRPHAGDRRVRALYLTKGGRATLARGRRVAAAHAEDLTGGLSAAERKQLTALLQRVVEEQGIGVGVHPGLSGRDEEG
jgi:DNA-binding MarR family transcriptional regulator